MNVTDFKTKLTALNLNDVEKSRVRSLTAKGLKHKLKFYTEFTEVTDLNYKTVWFKLNQQIAKENKAHRMMVHSLRSSSGYEDYSHLAYNNSSEDL
jgi:hypothetical protein